MDRFFFIVFCVCLSVAATCSDDLLWLDGMKVTCAESGLDCSTWFCKHCPFPATCDAHCGYCDAVPVEADLDLVGSRCGVDEIEDCAGACLKPSDCQLAAFGYTRCQQWIGNGCCDDGYGYVSDSGVSPDFNCARYLCDDGDCDQCVNARLRAPTGVRPASADNTSSSWCLLLTSSICPAQQMTHTARMDPLIRLRDYENSIAQWIGQNGTSLPMAIVESSGANLSSLRNIVPKDRPFDFVSFHDAGIEPLRGKSESGVMCVTTLQTGKGHAEYRSILRAMRYSSLLRNRCAGIIKITGRYFIHGLDAIIDRIREADLQVVVQSTPSPWTMWDGVLRSEVVGFENDVALVHALFENQDEAAGLPMERKLFTGARELRRHGKRLGYFPTLPIPATINSEHTHTLTEL